MNVCKQKKGTLLQTLLHIYPIYSEYSIFIRENALSIIFFAASILIVLLQSN